MLLKESGSMKQTVRDDSLRNDAAMAGVLQPL